MSAAGPPQGAKTPSGGSEDTPVPSVGASLDIEGLEVLVEGEGPHCIVMIHGWPDTARLWEPQVAALRGSYRCVRFTLPGFDIGKARRPTSLAEMVRLFAAVVDRVSPGAPVTLMLHDWGCIFGYEYAARHADRVARVIGVDIGNYNHARLRAELPARAKWFVLGYQLWLALSWTLGGALGDWMSRRTARWARWKGDLSLVGSCMSYPYHMRWFGSHGGLGSALRMEPRWPMLFFFGRRKPFQFQTRAWVEWLRTQPHCEAHAMDSGHWVMVDQPAAFDRIVADWLSRTPADRTKEASHA